MNCLTNWQCLGGTFIRRDGLTEEHFCTRYIWVLIRAAIAGVEKLKSSKSALYGAALERYPQDGRFICLNRTREGRGSSSKATTT